MRNPHENDNGENFESSTYFAEAVRAVAFGTMKNQAMARKLLSGRALDVERLSPELPTENGRVYRLERFVEDVDYCVASTEAWIWSIGRRLEDGAIFASVDTRFYANDAFECLWLR